MAAEQLAAATPAEMSQQENRAAYFRQSSWLMFATIASGGFTYAVHLLAKRIPLTEYGALGSLMALTMCVPWMPMQMVFAQQAAAALVTHREKQLRGMVRLAWLGTFGICLIAAVVLFFLQGDLAARWQISNPAALWVTLVAMLASFWLPIFLGLMQGQQNFTWYGWALMLNGAVRVGAATLFVVVFGAYAAGIMNGVALGLCLVTGIGIWQTRALWLGQSEPFDWRALLRQIIPLMLGFGAYQFLFAADTMFVRAYLPGQSEYYFAAGTLSRGLIWLVGPLTAVMFPKVVRSVARSEKTDVMGLTLLCTAVLAIAAVLGVWILGPFVVRLVYNPKYVEITTSILPWYAAVMVPLSLSSVLVNNLLARSEFRVVPALVIVAVAYGIALTFIHSSLVAVLQTLGVFYLLLLAVCVFFTWGPGRQAPRTATV